MTRAPDPYRESAPEIQAQASDLRALPYARVLEPTEPKGYYAARVLEFPGCISEGPSPAEAYTNLEEAFQAILELSLEDGLTIPEPFATRDYSGRVMLRVPPSLHQMAVEQAERDGVSLNRLLSAAVAFYLGAQRAGRASEVAPATEGPASDTTRGKRYAKRRGA